MLLGLLLRSLLWSKRNLLPVVMTMLGCLRLRLLLLLLRLLLLFLGLRLLLMWLRLRLLLLLLLMLRRRLVRALLLHVLMMHDRPGHAWDPR